MVAAWWPTRIFRNPDLDLQQSVTVFPRGSHDVTHSSSEWNGRPLEIPLLSPTHARGKTPSCGFESRRRAICSSVTLDSNSDGYIE